MNFMHNQRPNGPMLIGGLKVLISPDIPKMKLAPGDYVTPDFRKEIDTWLLDFFGSTNLIGDGQSIVSHATQTVWLSPAGYSKLKQLTP